MLKKIKAKLRKAAAVTAVTAVLVGAGAGAAQAVTYGSPFKHQTGGYWCPVYMYADYNWWEETFLGKRDGLEFQYWARC